MQGAPQNWASNSQNPTQHVNDLQMTWHISKFPLWLTLLNPAYFWDRGILRQLGEYFAEDPQQIKLFYLISLNDISKAKPGRTAVIYTHARQDKRSFSSDNFPFSFDSTCISLSQILSTHLSISNKPKCWDCSRCDKVTSTSVWFCRNFAQMVIL